MQASTGSTARRALKIFLALLAGAAVPALLVAIVLSISYEKTQRAGVSVGPAELLSAGLSGFLIALFFTAADAFILGLPLLIIGIKLHLIRWWSCLLVSFLIGLIPFAWVFGGFTPGVLPMGALGAMGGLTYWLLWRFWIQPPPQDAALPPPTRTV